MNQPAPGADFPGNEPVRHHPVMTVPTFNVFSGPMVSLNSQPLVSLISQPAVTYVLQVTS